MTDYVNQLENQIQDNRELVEKRDLAIKLAGNREFKKLIIDGFMLEDCARYVQMSQDPSIPAESRKDALRLAQAAGHLKRFLSVTVQMGNRGEAEILKIEEELQHARQEAADELMNGGAANDGGELQ